MDPEIFNESPYRFSSCRLPNMLCMATGGYFSSLDYWYVPAREWSESGVWGVRVGGSTKLLVYCKALMVMWAQFLFYFIFFAGRLEREIVVSLVDVKNWRFRCCCREIWFCPRGSKLFVRFPWRMSFFPFWIANLSSQRLATLNLKGCSAFGSQKWDQGTRGGLGLV